MSRLPPTASLAVLALLTAAPALAADRATVAVSCVPAGSSLVFDCTFRLTNARTGAPLDGAELTVGADMPSMPLAHNVRPVAAKPTGAPGEYTARLELEMTGDWALRIKVGGPLRDQLVEVLSFTEDAAGPPARKAGRPRPGDRR